MSEDTANALEQARRQLQILQRDSHAEKVRVLWGYAPNRSDPLPGASRNGGRSMIFKDFLVEMDHSLNNAHFRVTHDHRDYHCRNYCTDQPHRITRDNSWFQQPCECGVVHDGCDHDTDDALDEGAVYNVEYPRNGLQPMPELPPTLSQRQNIDYDQFVHYDEGINLSVELRTETVTSRQLLFW